MSLEQFIRDNRNAFDAEAPPKGLWESIEADLPASKEKPNHGFSVLRGGKLSRIAAAIALLVIGIGIGTKLGDGLSAESSKVALAELAPEYSEVEAYYQRDIYSKTQRLAQFTAQSNEVTNDLQKLELIMADLQKELENVPPARRQEVITAMIENYKTRASILERVLNHMEQKSKTNKNEPTNI